MITKKKSNKTGVCPLCTKEYKKGYKVYVDLDKPVKDRMVHSWCYERLMYARIKDTDPAPF